MYEITSRAGTKPIYRVFGYCDRTGYHDDLLFEGTLDDALAFLKLQLVADTHKHARRRRERLARK